MKTVRFSEVLKQAGRPKQHLLWIEPGKDRELQKAIKEQRAVTLCQPQTGKSDYGLVGFEKKFRGQVLIFPKSLKSFADRRIVAIKYDLLEEGFPSDRPGRAPKKKAPPKAIKNEGKKKEKPDRPAAEKVLHFPKPESPDPVSENRDEISQEEIPQPDRPDERLSDVDRMKAQVRHAIKAIKRKDHREALNLLKGLLDEA